MFYADSLAFLGPLAKVERADPTLAVDLAHITVAPPNVYDERKIAWWVRTVKAFVWMQGGLRPIYSRKELEVKPSGRHTTALVYGLQHPPSRGKLARLARQGVRVTTLGYEVENEYGSGFAYPTRGLTFEGKGLVDTIARCGMILDLSHASHQTARDALEYRYKRGLKLPVMASHTGCYEVYNHPRNLPLDVLRGIAAAGGYVGIYTLTFGLDPIDNNPRAFRRHLDYALEHLGSQGVGIGSDGVHKRMDAAARKAQFERMDKRLVAAANFRPRDPIEPEAFLYPDKFIRIERYLQKSCYWPTTLEGVLGGNFRRFLLQALP